jgi:hypothetical protein
MADEPVTYGVGPVVVGAQRLETQYAFATGKWSDAGRHSGRQSIEIHCYKRFSFCEGAEAWSADFVAPQAWVLLETFDILRWDEHEMIAVDSEAICVVNTLRFDFDKKQVSLSSTSKGITGNVFCKAAEADTKGTAFLIGKDFFTGKGKKQ